MDRSFALYEERKRYLCQEDLMKIEHVVIWTKNLEILKQYTVLKGTHGRKA